IPFANPEGELQTAGTGGPPPIAYRQAHRRTPRPQPCDVVPDPSILTNGRLNPLEGEILFSDANTDPDISFMHNDFDTCNLIVDHDRIVGLVDWEMAGFIGWKTAGEVHRRIRTP